ncbi:MAG: hypothetical protein ACRDY1_05870 [Acidimicrobiales bacterium]
MPAGFGNGGAAGPNYGLVPAGGGGGGGGGGWYGGGGGAGGYNEGGGGGAGPGSSYVDPSVAEVSYAGYSTLFGSIELIWDVADPPLMPTLIIPSNGGYADLAAGATFSFQYNPAAGSGYLQQWAFRDLTNSRYWNATISAWSGSIIWNDVSYLASGTASNFTYTFPAGVMTNEVLEWSIATTESNYNLGTASPAWGGSAGSSPNFYNTVTGKVDPIVTVTGTSPAIVDGAIDSVAPTVDFSVTYDSASFALGYAYVYGSYLWEGAGFAPGDTPTASFSTGGTSVALAGLAPDTYKVYIQVIDTDGLVNVWGSAGSFVEFQVALTTYDVPAFTAVDGFDPDNDAPVTVLTVTPSDTPEAVSVQYSDDGGDTWAPVVGCTMVHFTSGSVVMFDYTIPANNPRLYEVQENGVTTIGGVVYAAVSPWTDPISVTLTLGQWWLSDPTNGGGTPILTMPTPGGPVIGGAGSLGLHRIAGMAGGGNLAPTGGVQDAEVSIEIDQVEQQNTFYPFGRPIPVTVRGDIYEEIISAGVGVLFIGDQEWFTFNQIRLRQATVVLRSDMGDVYFGVIGGSRAADLIRAADRTTTPLRQLSFVFTPAPRPAS